MADIRHALGNYFREEAHWREHEATERDRVADAAERIAAGEPGPLAGLDVALSGSSDPEGMRQVGVEVRQEAAELRKVAASEASRRSSAGLEGVADYVGALDPDDSRLRILQVLRMLNLFAEAELEDFYMPWEEAMQAAREFRFDPRQASEGCAEFFARFYETQKSAVIAASKAPAGEGEAPSVKPGETLVRLDIEGIVRWMERNPGATWEEIEQITFASDHVLDVVERDEEE